MDIMELGAVGELVGGVAVIATLVYLAIQLKQTNRIARAQVRQESARMSTELLVTLDQTDLDLLAKVSRDVKSVSEAELRYAGSKFLGIANYYETLFYAREQGDVDDDLWRSRLQRMANFFGPAKESLWPIWKDTLGTRFQEFVEETVFKISPSQSTWARS